LTQAATEVHDRLSEWIPARFAEAPSAAS